MSNALSRGAAIVISATVSSAALGQEAPTLGLVYNTQEIHSLIYRCEPPRAAQITCEFVQTAVRAKATYAQLPDAIEQARKQFGSEKPFSAQECTTYRDMAAVFQGKKVAPKPEAISSLSPLEKTDMLRITNAFVAYCEKPTAENFVAIARVVHDRDRRTCNVSSHSYKQTFRLLSEPGGRPVWVTQSTPEGPCGIVQLSRFEPEETTIGGRKYTNWKYVARKAITNPTAELLPGAKCSGLDEAAYTYDWRSNDRQVSCDYIQFSPL